MSNRRLTGKNLTMPFAAATMAILLFVYTRVSIRAAKSNAAAHREADGGQISWQRQSLRQHGQLGAPVTSADGKALEILDAVAGSVPKEKGHMTGPVPTESATEEGIRARIAAEGRGK